MEAQVRAQLREGVLELSDVLVKTAALWIQKTMEEERQRFLSRPWGCRSDEAQGYANGYEPRRIASAEGPMEVWVPQVRGTKEAFRSRTVELLRNRTEKLEIMALQMYVGGLSYADIAEVFRTDIGLSNMSETVVMGLCRQLQQAYEEFSKRDLSKVELEYLFVDGMYLRVDRTHKTKEAVLVARGYTTTGHPVLLGMSTGPRESYESWKRFLSELRDRGLRCPVLTTSDGCAGMIKAIEDVFPESARQRCLFHMRGTLLSAAPADLRVELKQKLDEVFEASDYHTALSNARQLVKDYTGKAQSFVDKFQRHMQACLVFYRFPQTHWKNIRTSNAIERLFEEVKRRTKVIPAFGAEKSCLTLCHAVILELQRKKPWRRITMSDQDRQHLLQARTHLAKFGKRIESFNYRKAA